MSNGAEVYSNNILRLRVNYADCAQCTASVLSTFPEARLAVYLFCHFSLSLSFCVSRERSPTTPGAVCPVHRAFMIMIVDNYRTSFDPGFKVHHQQQLTCIYNALKCDPFFPQVFAVLTRTNAFLSAIVCLLFGEPQAAGEGEK